MTDNKQVNEIEKMKEMIINHDYAIKTAIETALGASKNLNIMQKFVIEEYIDKDLTSIDEDDIVYIYDLISNINEILAIFAGRSNAVLEMSMDLLDLCWDLIDKNGYDFEHILNKRVELNPDALTK